MARAAASLVAMATRSHGFSSLVIPRSTASSSSSSAFRLCRFLPFSTTSADTPPHTEEEPSAPPKGSSNTARGSEEWIVADKVKDDISRGAFRQPECLTLYLGSDGEELDIVVEEKTHDDCSESTSLEMFIKLSYYRHYLSKKVLFDVASQNGQVQVAFENYTTRSVDDDYFQENIQVLVDEFKGLLQQGGFSCKLDCALKFAKKLNEFKKRVEPKVESVHAESRKRWWCVILTLETQEDDIEIRVGQKDEDEDDKGLGIWITLMFRDNPEKTMDMEIDVDLLEDQGQVAIQNVFMSISEPDFQLDLRVQHLEEFKGLLEERGLNYTSLDFMVKCAKAMKFMRKTAPHMPMSSILGFMQ